MAQLAEAERSGAVDLMKALGHPVRLRLIEATLQGPRTVRELATLDGLGTSGQLYHHLRLLTDTGWLHCPRRGQYAITEERAERVRLAVATAQAASRRRTERRA